MRPLTYLILFCILLAVVAFGLKDMGCNKTFERDNTTLDSPKVKL